MKRFILTTTLVAGCLDLAAACMQVYLLRGSPPQVVLNYIASGIFGQQAMQGGSIYVITGIAVHFLIVCCCVLTYTYFYPRIKLLRKNLLLSAALIASIAWLLTTQVIVRLSMIHPSPFNVSRAAIAIAILYCCIGIPIAILTKKYFRRKSDPDRSI